jgi:hypothetical protein
MRAMTEPPDPQTLELEKIKVQYDHDLRSAELDLKRSELKLKEKEQEVSKWKNPLVVGVFVAALGLFGNIFVTWLQDSSNRKMAEQKSRNDLRLAHERAQSDLIIEAIRTGDHEKASANLLFFINAHLIDDPRGDIAKAVNAGLGPTLPAEGAARRAQSEWYGPSPNFPAALSDWKIAADRGDARAMANVGWMYENGYGAPQDYSQAMSWYKRAFDHGNIHSCWNIGRLYEFGYGVPLNLDTAREWYSKGAEKGDEPSQRAMRNLGHNDPAHM